MIGLHGLQCAGSGPAELVNISGGGNASLGAEDSVGGCLVNRLWVPTNWSLRAVRGRSWPASWTGTARS